MQKNSKDITVNFTSSAIKRIKEIFKSENNSKLKFRIYIVGGGCNGFQYGFILDEKVRKDDFLIYKKDIQVVIDNMSIQYLVGGWVDFLEELEGSRFIINNPNAKTTCGCGLSFSV